MGVVFGGGWVGCGCGWLSEAPLEGALVLCLGWESVNVVAETVAQEWEEHGAKGGVAYFGW